MSEQAIDQAEIRAQKEQMMEEQDAEWRAQLGCGDKVAVRVEDSTPLPFLWACGSSWERNKKEDPIDGRFVGAIKEIRKGMTTNGGEEITRVEIEWWGVDSSGHFGERHGCLTRLEHVRPV